MPLFFINRVFNSVWKTRVEKVEIKRFQTGFHLVFHSVLKVVLKDFLGNIRNFSDTPDRFPLFPTKPLSPVSTVLKKRLPKFHKIFPIFSLSTPQFFHSFTAAFPASGIFTFPLFLPTVTVETEIPVLSEKNRISTFSTPSTITTIFFLLVYKLDSTHSVSLSHRTVETGNSCGCRTAKGGNHAVYM